MQPHTKVRDCFIRSFLGSCFEYACTWVGDGEGGVVWITDFTQNWYIEGVVVTNLAYACDFLQVKKFFLHTSPFLLQTPR